VYKANISFIWTGIARVLWPTVLVTLILVYLALFDIKEKHWIEQFVALSLIGSIGVFLVLTSRTYLSMFLAWEIMLWSGFFIVRLTTHEKDVVKRAWLVMFFGQPCSWLQSFCFLHTVGIPVMALLQKS